MPPTLSRADIEVMRFLSQATYATPSEIHRATGFARKTVSQELARLSGLGFVQSDRRGAAKHFRLSDRKHAQTLRTLLLRIPSLRYEELLAGRSLDVLAAIHLLDLSSIREIEAFSPASHVTVVRLLRRYRRLGAVRKGGGRYRLGARYALLGDFLREYRSYTNLKTLRDKVADAAVVWERDRDVLFLSSARVEADFRPSAFSAFPRFGVDVFAGDGGYYFQSPRDQAIGPEEAAVHAMLAAESPRDRTLVLLLLLKARTKPQRLLHLGRIYGAVATARAFLDYVETRGRRRPQGFPSWDEVMERMREYA